MAEQLTVKPQELTDAQKLAYGINFSQSFEFGSHVAYMLEEIPKFMAAGRVEKAMRWLGFCQGYMVCIGVFSIDDMKQLNMPPAGDKT